MPPETEFQQSAMLRLISMSACAIIVVFVTLSAVTGSCRRGPRSSPG
jgi:hypothetical protein